jgi:hypothetical protein
VVAQLAASQEGLSSLLLLLMMMMLMMINIHVILQLFLCNSTH